MACKRIGIVGSANMDLVVRVDRTPGPGENVFGTDFQTIPGGKGANQAVAVARLGAEAIFFGKVGSDPFGSELLGSLRGSGVDTTHTMVDPGAPTGTALITVNRQGQNAIVVCPGANGRLLPEDVDSFAHVLKGADAIVMQLEIPIETVVHTIRMAKQWNVPIILDAGPPCVNPPEEIFQVAVLTPNEAEASALVSGEIRDLQSAESAARDMLNRGSSSVVLKLGEKGALLLTKDTSLHVEAHDVSVVDTTAAGDAFTAALAVYLAEGLAPAEAVRKANIAGALATTKLGAQPSMPTRNDIERFAP